MTIRFSIGVALAASLVGFACGTASQNLGDNADGGGGSASVAFTGGTLLSSLDAAELATLCDTEASKLGGYGAEVRANCGDGGGSASTNFAFSQQECVEGFSKLTSNCAATVSDDEACVADEKELLCDTTGQFPLPAACVAINLCGL
jgi:hypothetical protein